MKSIKPVLEENKKKRGWSGLKRFGLGTVIITASLTTIKCETRRLAGDVVPIETEEEQNDDGQQQDSPPDNMENLSN